MPDNTRGGARSPGRRLLREMIETIEQARMLFRPRDVGLMLLLAIAVACTGGEESAEVVRKPSEAREGAVSDDDGRARAKGEEKEGEEREAGAGKRVTLGEAAFRTARIAVESPVPESIAASTGGFEVPGEVDFDPARVALVSPRASGRLEQLLVVPGDRVGAGQTVALVQSTAFLTAQNDVLQARRRFELLRETPDSAGAKALLDAAHRRLALFGLGEADVRRLEESGDPNGLLPVAAPFAGSIIDAQALAGQAVEAGTPLYKIADLSVVNVAAEVPERALPALHLGQGASIRVTGAPQTAFAGRVTRVSDVLDPEKRTTRAMITVANRGRTLKPGMYAVVSLSGSQGSKVRVLTIPASAVISDGPAQYVFVEVGLRTYERRPVELAPVVVAGGGPAGGRVSVVSGLDPEDRVVVRGAFTLKSELAKATLVDVD